MLSNILLEKLLGPGIYPNIDEIHWKTQDSNSSTLLFYKIVEGQESLFSKRIDEAKFAWLIVNKKVNGLPQNCSVVDEKKWPEIQKEILDILYPLPSKLKLIGITGTNGKTTTTDLVLQIGELCGFKGLSIGTLGVREYKKTILDFGMTSPPFIDLRKYLNRYGPDKDFCVMEASSHALSQDRLYKINFNVCGWLSFSQDHLDYHKSMEAYFDAKIRIFDHLLQGGRLFVPVEQKELLNNLLSKRKNTVTAPELKGPLPIFFKAQFNKNNLEVALAVIGDVFGRIDNINLEKIEPPEGRFYIRNYGNSYIVVDFAHTPDALDNICRSIRDAFPGFSLKILFGCGGDRDRSKRSLMGEVADKWADIIYLTSDNPRNEDPQKIIEDISKGIQQHLCFKLIDRPNAVKRALSELGEKEVLILAGKGHEDYILIKGVKHPYSDIVQVDEFLKRHKA